MRVTGMSIAGRARTSPTPMVKVKGWPRSTLESKTCLVLRSWPSEQPSQALKQHATLRLLISIINTTIASARMDSSFCSYHFQRHGRNVDQWEVESLWVFKHPRKTRSMYQEKTSRRFRLRHALDDVDAMLPDGQSDARNHFGVAC